MTSQRCPQCERIDAAAKVSAIVKSGTRYSTSYDTKEESSYRDNGVEWSFNFDSVTTTTQTILARQLDFPDKGGTTMFLGWLAFIFFCPLAVITVWGRDKAIIRTGGV
jgi:hypothetical protein